MILNLRDCPNKMEFGKCREVTNIENDKLWKQRSVESAGW